MPQSRSSSADSRTTAGKSSNSSGSVLSRVLGSFRRSARDGDGAAADAKEEEDPNWANNYKITHYPDRPRHDKRAGLRHRNSVYVLGQLRKIWKYNGKMTEVKRRERAARERAFAAGMGRSSSQNRGSRGGERRRNGGGGDSSSGPSPGNLQADLASNLDPTVSSPQFPGNRRQGAGEEQRHKYNFLNTTSANEAHRKEERHVRPVSSPSSISGASDRMTIRVGLEVHSPSAHGEEESGGLKMRPGRAETGGRGHAPDDIPAVPSMPSSAPRFLTPLPTQSQSAASPFLSSEQKEAARRPQRQTLPHNLQQLVPLNMMQPSSAREKALRETLAPLRINKGQDSTPGLVASSLPVSNQASAATPNDVPSDRQHTGRRLPSTNSQQKTKTCPMPLCDNPLLTAADQQQNLCAECRSDLQPRQSIFRTDVPNPILPLRTSTTKGHAKPRASLGSHVRRDSTVEVASASAKRQPQTSRYVSGEGKPRTANRGDGDRSANKVRATETPPPSSRREKSGVSSRFNNKERSEFRLQPAPLSRKLTRRGPGPGSSNSPTGYGTSIGQKKPDDVDGTGNNHVGLQLTGRDTATPNPTRRQLQRKPSGPLLEPKTFRPPTPPLPTGKNNKDGSATKNRASESRRRVKGVSVRSSSGRALSSPRAHVDKKGNHHRVTEPMPKVQPPGSPGYRINRRQPKQHHSEYRGVGRGVNVPGNPANSDSNARAVEKTSNSGVRGMADINEDIYREIDNIIDCYLRLPGAPEWENEKRKAEAIASYFAEVPLDVEMKIKGFI
ncbi:hypothetical protein F4859DRAFT_24693 [Xylaria cf. heliscus]|nr:hypothetical protein F4859DRAFT_24693 [Xylaria cf. heliscus]